MQLHIYIPRGGGRKPKINKYKRKRPAQKRKNKKVYKKKVLPRNVRKTIKKPLTKTEKRNKIEQIFLPHVTLPKKKSARFFVYNSYKGKGENVEQTVYQLPPPPKTGPSDRSVLSAVNKIVNARNNFGRLLTKRKKVERQSVNRRKKWLKRKKPALIRKAMSKVNKKKKANVVRPVTKRVKRKTPAVVKKAWRKIHKKRKAKALRRKLPKRKQQSAKLVLKTTDGHGLDMCEKSETDIPQEVKNLDPHTQFVYKLVTRLPVESKVIVMGKINSKPFKKLLQTVDIIKKCDEIDFAQTSFKSNSYDLLIYNHTLYGQDFQTLILEANRLIKNGGQLAIIDVYSDQDNEKQFLQSMADAGFLLIRQNIANKTTWEYVFEKIKRVAKSVYLQPFTLAVAKYRRPIDHFK
ncbi:uncharacterized protein LOC119688319 [Teleopsis dalmanni]|uniref:uncharacterized protein LOC119688319 n=1 Tax=Teleopsis dalmanni TaxID=139649 RepID=UPI0018CDD922|nr:uncharacterized protein LOC119688319 [Teleopsis dalmanni]